jgi:hypothetical protein
MRRRVAKCPDGAKRQVWRTKDFEHRTLFSIPFSYRACTARDIAYLCIAKHVQAGLA